MDILKAVVQFFISKEVEWYVCTLIIAFASALGLKI